MSLEKNTDLTYQRARQALVDEISSKGISDLRVLDAFLKTPRHLFIDGAFLQELIKICPCLLDIIKLSLNLT